MIGIWSGSKIEENLQRKAAIGLLQSVIYELEQIEINAEVIKEKIGEWGGSSVETELLFGVSATYALSIAANDPRVLERTAPTFRKLFFNQVIILSRAIHRIDRQKRTEQIILFADNLLRQVEDTKTLVSIELGYLREDYSYLEMEEKIKYYCAERSGEFNKQ